MADNDSAGSDRPSESGSNQLGFEGCDIVPGMAGEDCKHSWVVSEYEFGRFKRSVDQSEKGGYWHVTYEWTSTLPNEAETLIAVSVMCPDCGEVKELLDPSYETDEPMPSGPKPN